MGDILPPIVYELGLGGFLGFIVGFSVKKLGKLILVLAGLFVTVLVYLRARRFERCFKRELRCAFQAFKRPFGKG